MAPHITHVDIKDAFIVKEQGGLVIKPVFQVRVICRSKRYYAPHPPGDDEPQVTAYGLEEEVDYYAPAFRFEDEDDNPWIPYRQMSETPLPENHFTGCAVT